MTTPTIESDGWGRIVVAGDTYKDVVLGPHGVRAWDWDDDGTSHAGMAAAPVRELLDAGVTHLLLATGRQGRLNVPDDVVALAQAQDVDVSVLGTADAIDAYARLQRDGAAVGAVLHTTC